MPLFAMVQADIEYYSLHGFLWAVYGLLILLLLAPLLSFLIWGWSRRRAEILSSLSDAATASYLRSFCPGTDHDVLVADKTGRTTKNAFLSYYRQLFGRLRYFLPILLLISLSCIFLLQPLFMTGHCLDAKQVEANLEILKGDPNERGEKVAAAEAESKRLKVWLSESNSNLWVIAFAILGGYTRVLYEICTRFYQDNIRSADVYWWCYRLIICVPLGYTIGLMLDAATTARFAGAAAFLLGLFPTTTVTKWGQKLLSTWLLSSELKDRQSTQLDVLPALDEFGIEAMAEEGVTTFTQLAYIDPIRLSIRSGLNFSYVVTCQSEALLATQLLTRQNMEYARHLGIWGAYEAVNVWQGLISDNEVLRNRSSNILKALSIKLNTDYDGLCLMFEQISRDPYVEFLRELWASNIQG